MTYVIHAPKTNAGIRKLPLSDDVCECFQTIIEERVAPKVEKMVDGYSGFLFLDEGRRLNRMHRRSVVKNFHGWTHFMPDFILLRIYFCHG